MRGFSTRLGRCKAASQTGWCAPLSEEAVWLAQTLSQLPLLLCSEARLRGDRESALSGPL